MKRSRSDSPESDEFDAIPGFLFTKKSKSESPYPSDFSRTLRSRGVEVFHLESHVDRHATTESIISSLKQQGKRVISDPRVLGNNKGGQDLTVEWILDYDYFTQKTEDEIKLGGSSSHQTSALCQNVPESQNLLHGNASRNTSGPQNLRSGYSNNVGTSKSSYSAQATGVGSILDPITLTDDECDLHEQVTFAMTTDIHDSRVLSGSDDEVPQFAMANKDVKRIRDLYGTDDEESDSTDDDDEYEDDIGYTTLPISAIAPPLSPDISPVRLRLPHSREESPNTFPDRKIDKPVPFVRTQSQSRVQNGLAALSEGVRKTSIKKSRETPDSKIMETSHGVKNILLPATPHGRARRIIANNRDIWSAVTMGGDVRFINGSRRYVMQRCSMPGDTSNHVEDVCLVGDTLVIGYGRVRPPVEQSSPQIQTFCLGDITNDTPPSRICIEHRPHCGRGVKSLSAIDHTKFLSGGYNKRIHLWTLSEDGEPDSQDLKVFFKSGPVHGLAFVPETKTVLGASGKYLKVIDIEKPIDVTYTLSRNVRHIHSSQLPNIISLEVEDLYEQVHVFDTRAPGFTAVPALRFGRQEQRRNRYTRGSLQHSYFARGYDSTVLLWDFRNTKNVVVKLETKRDKSVVHTMFSGFDVVAFGKSIVSVYEKVV